MSTRQQQTNSYFSKKLHINILQDIHTPISAGVISQTPQKNRASTLHLNGSFTMLGSCKAGSTYFLGSTCSYVSSTNMVDSAICLTIWFSLSCVLLVFRRSPFTGHLGARRTLQHGTQVSRVCLPGHPYRWFCSTYSVGCNAFFCSGGFWCFLTSWSGWSMSI